MCSTKKNLYNTTASYQKTICLVNEARNYTDSRLNCQRNGMQLYDLSESLYSETELLKFANMTLSSNVGRTYFTKGRNNLQCAIVSNAAGSFSEGFGSCSSLSPSFCQFLEASRKNHKT